MRYAILAQSEVTARALGAWLELLGEDPLKPGDPLRLVLDVAYNSKEGGVLDYEFLVNSIEAATAMSDGSLALNEVIVLVDSIQISQMNLLAESGTWENLLAMLILTFPEIRWHFGVIQGHDTSFPAAEHQLGSLLTKARRDPLFDGTGLRNWVRCRINDRNHILANRLWSACAIDEEKSFAYFHAYTAYRHNFKCDVVTSRALMADLFRRPAPHGYWLLLEDIRLNFPDRTSDDEGISDLRTRGNKYESLSLKYDDSHFRAIITTGGVSNPRKNTENYNRQYLKDSKPEGHSIMHKPTDGMMGLWKDMGMDRALRSCPWNGYAHGYSLPSPQGDDDSSTQHSAPGKLMLISETLFRRAEVFRDQATTVKDFIKGAVMANDAFELLGAKTPMLSLTCLKLKHEYEVKAECVFFGTHAEFDVKTRCEELLDFIHHVFSSLPEEENSRRNRRAACIEDAYAAILNRLILIYRDAGQFHEEHECLIEQKRALRRLKKAQPHEGYRDPKNFALLVWDRIIRMIVSYAEYLLESFSRFVRVVSLWVIGGAFMLWALGDPSGTGFKAAWESIGVSVNAFVGGGVAAKEGGFWMIAISSALAVAGVFHLGVLISFLYTKISRR